MIEKVVDITNEEFDKLKYELMALRTEQDLGLADNTEKINEIIKHIGYDPTVQPAGKVKGNKRSDS